MSILGMTKKNDLLSFKWEKIIQEAETVASCLLHVLKISPQTKNDKKTSTPIIGLIISILCYFRRSMSIVQKVVSTILYAGHCSKQVNKDIYIVVFND